MLLRRETEDQLNSTDREGITALHHIVRSIHWCSGREGEPDTHLARYCIDHGADVTIRDDHGNIPLNMTLSSARSLDDWYVQRGLTSAARPPRNHTQAQLPNRNLERQTPLRVALTAERQCEALVLPRGWQPQTLATTLFSHFTISLPQSLLSSPEFPRFVAEY